MREYGQISPQFWIGETGKKIRGNVEAQIIALYLMTSPHSHMTGIFHCPVLYMSYETGIPLEGASKGLRRLIEVGFCEYDEPSETVFVIKMAMYQIGESLKHGDNRIAGLKKELQKMPETPMKHKFINIYNDDFCLGFEVKNTSPSEAPSKPLRSQEQEQEQEQEKTYDVSERVTTTTLCSGKKEKTGADAPRSQTPKLPDKFSQTQIPQDFEPERAGISLAEQHELDVNKEVERFVAHYTANGALRANWQAQFRKWLLQAAQLKADALKRTRSPPNGGGGKQQLMMEAGRSLFAHRDEEKGHEREIEGTAEFVERDTDKPVAGIVD